MLVKRAWGISVAFEDEREADALLDRALGDARAEIMFSAFDGLLSHCDSRRLEDRIFARQLFSKLIRRQEKLALRLARSRMHIIQTLIRTEPMWALTSCWLPLLGRADLTELMEIAISRMTKAPETVAEFCLWVEAYGAESAGRFLSRRLSSIREWDCSLVIRYAAMVRKLPRSEQRRAGRQFTGLFMDLPAAARYQSLGYKQSFPLLARLTAVSGRWFDRNQAVEDFGRFLTDRALENLPVPQNWYEAYFELVQRMLQQERNGLGLALTREVLAGGEPAALEERYESVRKNEDALSIDHLVLLGVRLLRDYGTGLFIQGESSGVPSNILKLAACWAKPDGFKNLYEEYLATIEAVGRWGVPLDRVAPLVMPSGRLLGRLTEDQRRSFLRTIFRWLPAANDLPSEETAKFMFRLCRLVIGQPWVGDEISAGLKNLFKLLPVDGTRARLEGMRAMTELLKSEGCTPIPLASNLGLPDDWMTRGSLAEDYIIQARAIRWAVDERSVLADSIVKLAADTPRLVYAACSAMLRLHIEDKAVSLGRRLAEARREWPEPHALLSIAAARVGDLESAYVNLAELDALWDRYEVGLNVALVHWMHGELAIASTGQMRAVHMVCAELAHYSRLTPYEELMVRVHATSSVLEIEEDDVELAEQE
jgi:hypothetical protein